MPSTNKKKIERTVNKMQESDLSPGSKEKLRQILAKASVARSKKNCRDLGLKYVHTIETGVHPPTVSPESMSCCRNGPDCERAECLRHHP